MKARLLPLYFKSGRNHEFDVQVDALRKLLEPVAEIMEPHRLGSALPAAHGAVLPQVLGDAYAHVREIKALQIPLLAITSEFGTVSMWDWEIMRYLREQGVETIGPYSLDQANVACRGLAAKHELRKSRFLVFQDNPGAGFQADIFKRFYWWENKCIRRMKTRFGVAVVKKSLAALGAAAKRVSDADAGVVIKGWRGKTPGVSAKSLRSAAKLYVALRHELDRDPRIRAAGINCLNESRFSDTTPCLAWNLLFEELDLIWGCEADLLSMLTLFILYHSLQAPMIMSNLYPFLLGNAATTHEHIPTFPDVDEPENCILVAHCGYLGVVPQSFATTWSLRPKVLEIVDDSATAIDARLPAGAVTLAKLGPGMQDLHVVEGNLDRYVQFPGSHCLNGAVLKIRDGRRFMAELFSHHYILIVGHHLASLRMLAPVFGLRITEG
ncbi:hypothetical protein ACFLQU_05310 [Verrucomicrobiota bacterium]